MTNYSNYDAADRRIIGNIVTVKEWNEGKPLSEQIKVKYGYVMPVFHGWEWKPTKQALINKYCYGPK